jgi:hypothetical protein
MTMDVYAHVAPEVEELAVDAFAAAFSAVTNPSPSSAGSAPSEGRETPQKACGVLYSNGHERFRTSDPYSVKEIIS